MTTSVDPVRLNSWLEHRIGYGSLEAPLWFVGMEESCQDVSEFRLRIQGDHLEDLPACLTRLSPRFDRLLAARPRLQSTWRPLLRIYARACGLDGPPAAFNDALRILQRDQWGRLGGATLLAELLPLPSPNAKTWLYRATPTQPELASRSAYEATWIPRRTAYLRSLWCAADHRRVAVAYGSAHEQHYRAVFGVGDSEGLAIPGAPFARSFVADDHAVILIPHTTFHGPTNLEWDAIGTWVGRFLKGSGAYASGLVGAPMY